MLFEKIFYDTCLISFYTYTIANDIISFSNEDFDHSWAEYYSYFSISDNPEYPGLFATEESASGRWRYRVYITLEDNNLNITPVDDIYDEYYEWYTDVYNQELYDVEVSEGPTIYPINEINIGEVIYGLSIINNAELFIPFVYSAYYNLLSEQIASQGLGWDSRNNRGVMYAELLDFDNDGTPELLIGSDSSRNGPVISIYCYSDEVHKLADVPVLAGGDYDEFDISFANNAEGQHYLLHATTGIDYAYTNYYTVRENKWVEVSYTSDLGITSSRNCAFGWNYWIVEDFDGYDWIFDEHSEPVYDIETVHAVLAELEAHRSGN